jgi:hypothetical protein
MASSSAQYIARAGSSFRSTNEPLLMKVRAKKNATLAACEKRDKP